MTILLSLEKLSRKRLLMRCFGLWIDQVELRHLFTDYPFPCLLFFAITLLGIISDLERLLILFSLLLLSHHPKIGIDGNKLCVSYLFKAKRTMSGSEHNEAPPTEPTPMVEGVVLRFEVSIEKVLFKRQWLLIPAKVEVILVFQWSSFSVLCPW